MSLNDIDSCFWIICRYTYNFERPVEMRVKTLVVVTYGQKRCPESSSGAYVSPGKTNRVLACLRYEESAYILSG